jgi:lipopolysaccharide transport system permease protein
MGVREDCERLIASRDLLFVWTRREFKARYAGSALGLAWAVLYPLALLLVFLLVFTWLLNVPTAGVPAILFLYSGLAPWLFSSTTIQNSAFAVIANVDLVKTAAFPREILPLATVFVGCVDFAISAALLALLLAYYHVPVGLPLLLVPLLVLVQSMLTLALCLFLAGSVVPYRDVRFLVPVGLQFWMYLSPVFYPISLVPGWARSWYLLNPMAALLDAYRDILLFDRWPAWLPLLAAIITSSLGLWGAYRHFKRAEWEFADRS